MGSWGWLMVSVWKGPVRCRLARLELLFTQPLLGQTEGPYFHTQVLSKENLLQRPPRLRYTSVKTIHTASCCSCRVACFSCTLILIIQRVSMGHYSVITVFLSNLNVIFPSAPLDFECVIANILHFLSWHYSQQENLLSLCVIWWSEFEKLVF